MRLPPILTTTDEVAELAVELQRCSEIAVDLEADSMHNYREKVCLLQFSTPQTTLLVDPLAGASLEPLKPVLVDSRVRKIFHAADYDIRCLARDFDIEISGLFDTMISSQFLGEEKFGLADMLRKYFGVELDKQYQRADWSIRPLSEGMICYAAEDTCHLHELAALLERQLEEKGRLSWVKEEFSLLEKVRFTVHQGPEFLRFKGAGTLEPRQLAVLEGLLQWRDNEAQRRDCPLYKVLGNKSLLQISRIMPAGKQELQGVEGFSSRLIERYGAKILQVTEAAESLPDTELPVYPRGERRLKDPAVERRFTSLKEWRKKVAKRLALDPGVLINNAQLEELARQRPTSQPALEATALLKNWQFQELGEGILKVLN